MPQLDFTSYPPQLVWLAIAFVLLYLLMARVALPRVTQVLERRQAQIATDLEKAEKRKVEAEEALAAYEKTMANARSDAQAAIRAAADEIAKKQAAREATFAAEIAKRTDEAEKQISDAKSRAMAETRDMAADLAAAIAGRLANMAPQRDRITAAVDAVRQERS